MRSTYKTCRLRPRAQKIGGLAANFAPYENKQVKSSINTPSSMNTVVFDIWRNFKNTAPIPLKWETAKRSRLQCLKKRWCSSVFGTRRFVHLHRGTTARWNAATVKTTNTFMRITGSTHLRISKSS